VHLPTIDTQTADLRTLGEVHALSLSRGQRVLVEHAARLVLSDPASSGRDRAAARVLQDLAAQWHLAELTARAEDVARAAQRLRAARTDPDLTATPALSGAVTDRSTQ
jgi:hypothetical protein